ncbi:LOW QUALITY PROTEIN: SHC-transforming protein 1 [Pteropus alecto]|uniref:LOW QUALITY PROTEIN: SHC-transforming protein 1 n=1 Tax=Pteropus alecto TaxID=9402 RepID=UPI0003F11E05|nr:LOW QUALITY PROTEIN: SHC-transforming protein 1 [Pteropus alecto]
MPLPGPLALTGRGAGPGSSLPLAPAMDLLPPKPKYNPLRNESLSSLEEGASGSTPPEELPSPSASSLGPILPPLPGDDSPTTLCSFFPRMSNLKLANPAGGRLGPKAEPGRAAEDGEGTTGAAVPDSGPLPLLQDMNKLSGGGGRRTRVEGGQLGGEEWTRHGSFVNKPTRGWLHPNDKVMGPGVSYLVRYMGCVEVLQSMRALDFNTRTQVTREAISLVCEAVPGAKGATRRRKPCSRPLSSILGRSNLKFAGMKFAGLPITLTVSTSSLNLMAADCKQIIANHHMQSISFASGGDPDTAEYVAYVAKDPVNQRACHILECPEGLAQDVISTIGQAFELRFKQYLRNPPKLVTPHDRMAGFDGSAWDEEEEEPPDHQYYNDFPGKEPPLGGVVDMRLREGAAPAATRPTPPSAQPPTQLGATLPVGQPVGGDPEVRKQMPPPPPCPGRELFDDPSYVNVQHLDKARHAGAGAGPPGLAVNGGAPRDLFDMKPFEDALRAPPPPHSLAMAEQLRGEPWFHGKLSRREAEALLQLDGDFLVRESTTTPGQYVLTGLQSGQPKHLLLVDPEGVVRTKDHRFESVSHLISHHMDNHLPIISAGSELCLQQPVTRRP